MTWRNYLLIFMGLMFILSVIVNMASWTAWSEPFALATLFWLGVVTILVGLFMPEPEEEL